jgi:hypothetical protein
MSLLDSLKLYESLNKTIDEQKRIIKQLRGDIAREKAQLKCHKCNCSNSSFTVYDDGEITLVKRKTGT